MLSMEFFNPCQPFSQAAFQSHIQRYAFAAQFVSGKRVLDIACGSGFGSSFLKKSGAEIVVGGDISPEAISASRRNYKQKEVDFFFLDGSRLPFNDGSFDVAVSFETLEHIPDYERFIQELRRVIRKGGNLVLSTPNKSVFSPCLKRPMRAYHTKEFRSDELEPLLRQAAFSEISLYGQLHANRLLQLRWPISFLLPSVPGGKLLARLAITLLKDSRLRAPDSSIGKSTSLPLDPRYAVSPMRNNLAAGPAILVAVAVAD